MDEKQVKWKRKTILFLISQCITLFGSTLVQMAIVWYVTIRTSSGGWVAAFTVCSYVPQFLISFVGGVWADRYSRKKLIIGADTLIAVITFIMVLLIPYIKAEPTLLSGLLIMSIFRSFGAGVQTPAVNAVIPQLVPKEELMRFNGINATMQSVVQFAAPAAAGALLSVSTLSSTLMVDIVTALIGVGLLAGIMIPRQEPLKETVSILSDMKTGISYAYVNKILGKVLIVYGLFILFSVPAGFLAQLLVSRVYGNTYWYLTAVELIGFMGMVLGGIVMSTWGGFKSRIKTMVVGLIVFAMLSIGMGLSKNFILYLGLMLLYGIAITMVQTATTTFIQENTEESMQGRIFGLMGSMYAGFLPLGMAVFGPMADIINLQWIIIGSGIVLFIVAAIMKGNYSLKE